MEPKAPAAPIAEAPIPETAAPQPEETPQAVQIEVSFLSYMSTLHCLLGRCETPDVHEAPAPKPTLLAPAFKPSGLPHLHCSHSWLLRRRRLLLKQGRLLRRLSLSQRPLQKEVSLDPSLLVEDCKRTV